MGSKAFKKVDIYSIERSEGVEFDKYLKGRNRFFDYQYILPSIREEYIIRYDNGDETGVFLKYITGDHRKLILTVNSNMKFFSKEYGLFDSAIKKLNAIGFRNGDDSWNLIDRCDIQEYNFWQGEYSDLIHRIADAKHCVELKQMFKFRRNEEKINL